MKHKNTIISLAMIASVGIAVWTTILCFHPEPRQTPKTASLPDAFMEDVTAIILDKQGRPSMKIITPKLVHFPENDTTHITTPQLTLYRKSPIPWYITSNYAKAWQGIENLDFWENVTIHHAGDINNPATMIKTATLTVYPNKKIAQTKDLITLSQPNLVIKGMGLYADMNTGNIKLLSSTRGEYVPNS